MRGAYPPPPAPPASGKVPVPGTGRSTGGGAVGRRGRKSRNNVKLSSRFSAEKQLHVFAPTCRLQSIGGGVRACREYVKSWGCLVRGEMRRKSPLSLPRTPLFRAERYMERDCISGEFSILKTQSVQTVSPAPIQTSFSAALFCSPSSLILNGNYCSESSVSAQADHGGFH